MAIGKETHHASHFPVSRDVPQAEIADVRERHHYRQTVEGQTEQIEPLEMTRKGTAADILNGGDAVIRVDDFLTNLKSHAWALKRRAPSPA
jgi:hypothetical protein